MRADFVHPFWIGETVRALCRFTDDTAVPLVAIGVTFTARAPDGEQVTGSPVPLPQAGVYYADFLLDRAGVWSLRAACSGPTSAVDETEIVVRPSTVL